MKELITNCRNIRVIAVICSILALLASGACSPSYTTPPASSSPPTTTATTPTAMLSIISPTNEASVPEGNITVTTQVNNFNVVDKQSQASVSGEGHLHFYLDVDAPTTPGQPATLASGVWAHVASTSYTFSGVTPGTHTISVQLVNNDHTPLSPAVVAKITITVTGSGGGY